MTEQALGKRDLREIHPQGDKSVRVVGSGFREHSLFELALRSPQVAYIDIAPGNGGTTEYNIPIAATDIIAQVADAKARGINTVIVGPEDPLALGITDRMNSAGIDVFGPREQEAKIESSKLWAIELMEAAGVKHPRTKYFYKWDLTRRYIKEEGWENIVIKEDGLRAGKGVFVPDSEVEATKALDEVFGKKYKHGDPVLIQERIKGTEASFMAIVDGEHIVPLLSAQDYKRVGDGDTGPNTGGMGAFAPTKTIDSRMHKRIMNEIMHPIVGTMREQGMKYKGILYAGLMIDENGNPIVIEFNCRGGDPEWPIVGTLFEENFDIIDVIDAVKNGTLKPEMIKFIKNKVALGIVAASEGYPQNPIVGRPISGLDQTLDKGSYLFQAGTRREGTVIKTSGGRVALGVGTGKDFAEAKAGATKVIDNVVFEGKHQRSDIGDIVINN